MRCLSAVAELFVQRTLVLPGCVDDVSSAESDADSLTVVVSSLVVGVVEAVVTVVTGRAVQRTKYE